MGVVWMGGGGGSGNGGWWFPARRVHGLMKCCRYCGLKLSCKADTIQFGHRRGI